MADLFNTTVLISAKSARPGEWTVGTGNNTTNIDIEMQDNSLPSIIIEEDKKYLRIKETTKEAKDKKPKKEDLEHTKALKLEMKLASIKSKTDYSHLYSSG